MMIHRLVMRLFRRIRLKIDSSWAHSVFKFSDMREIGSVLLVSIEFRHVGTNHTRTIVMDGVVAESIALSILEELGYNVDEIKEGKDISDGKPGFDGSRY